MTKSKDALIGERWFLKLELGRLLRSAAELKGDLALGKVAATEREAIARLIVGLELAARDVERRLHEVGQPEEVD